MQLNQPISLEILQQQPCKGIKTQALLIPTSFKVSTKDDLSSHEVVFADL